MEQKFNKINYKMTTTKKINKTKNQILKYFIYEFQDKNK